MGTITKYWWPLHIIITSLICDIGYHFYAHLSIWIGSFLVLNTIGLMFSFILKDNLYLNSLRIISFTIVSDSEEQLEVTNGNLYRRKNVGYCKICSRYNIPSSSWLLYPSGYKIEDRSMLNWLDAQAEAYAKRQLWDKQFDQLEA